MAIPESTKDRILAAYEQEKTASKVALVLNLSPSTVNRVLREAGVAAEHKTVVAAREARAAHAPRVREMIDRGMSGTQICKELHIGWDSLQQIAEEHGITVPPRSAGRPSNKNRHLPHIKELAKQGGSLTEISRLTGVKLGTLHRWVTEEGIVVTPGSPSGRIENFGATSEQRSQAAKKGGEKSALGLTERTCDYGPCGEVFTRGRKGSGRMERKRYCCPEHAYAAIRESSGKSTVYTCEYCGEDFVWWTNQPRKFCSSDHYFKSNKQVPKFGFDGQVLESSYEALFVGLCALKSTPFEFFDRSEIITTKTGERYGPDFLVPAPDGPVYVDTKGQDHRGDLHKWMAFRAQKGKLAILFKADLERLLASTDLRSDLIFIADSQESFGPANTKEDPDV